MRTHEHDPPRHLPGRRPAFPRASRASLPLALLVLALAAGAGPASSQDPRTADPNAADSAEAEEPVLEGTLKPIQVLNVTREWSRNFKEYQPDAELVEKIRAVTSKQELTIDVVVGTWCSDSRREVPRFMKVQQLLGSDRLKATFMGVDRSKKQPAEVVEGRKITAVPTFIVYHNGVEIGRITESPEISVESDLAGIVARAAGS